MNLYRSLLLAIGISILISTTSAKSQETPELTNELGTTQEEFLPVVFIFKVQLGFEDIYSSVRNLPLPERRQAVVNALQRVAGVDQQNLKQELLSLEKNGHAKGMRSLWISNVIKARIQAKYLQDILAAHPEIDRVLFEAPQPAQPDHLGLYSILNLDDCDEISWGVVDINAPLVWNFGVQGEGIIIADLDIGVDYTHPDLADRIWVNPGEDANGNGVADSSDWNGIDDDQNGYVDDLRGWSFPDSSSEVMDILGQGTANAGILCGDGTSGTQTGVAPGAKLMILKNFTVEQSDFWEAEQYALEMGADLICSSLAYKWFATTKPDYATMRHNADMELAAGMIHINTIGDEGDDLSNNPIPFNIAAPANCPPPWLHPDQTLIGGISACLGIGSYGANHDLKPYSSIGPSAWSLRDILDLDPAYPWGWQSEYNDYPYENGQQMGLLKPDLCAPVDVTSTALGGGYTLQPGPDAAAPHIGGMVALLLSAAPFTTPESLAEVIMTNSVDMGIAGKDNFWGCGRPDAFAALADLLSGSYGGLTGTITDGSTGSPIVNAMAAVPELSRSAQSDSNGYYWLPLIQPGTHDVRFSAAGFETHWVQGFVFSVAVIDTLSVSLNSVGIQEEPRASLPTEFKVGPAYPNPFNVETVIPVELPQRSHVKVEIYNLRGQRVCTAYNGVKNAGWAQIRYSAVDLASGIYFCRITAEGLGRGGKYINVGKILLLK